jgi:Flp pilus assembly protein TadD
MAAAQIERARALQEIGRHQDALDVLESAVQDEPLHATVQSLRAISLAVLHRFDEAIRTARVALEAAPSDPFGHFALGKVLALKGDFKAARESVSAAIEIQPDVSDYYCVLAATHHAEQRWKHALAALDRALQLDPENRWALFAKATVLSARGKRSEAMRLTESLLQIDPHHASGLALYESLQRQAGLRNVATLSLQANPRQTYVKYEALNDILRRSVMFWWVVTMDRVGTRIGARWMVLITMVGGVALWLLSVTDPSFSRPVRNSLRATSWLYAVFVFASFFGWCIGDVYLRFHASGRWLLSGLRRRGAEMVAAGLAAGSVLLVAAAVARSRELALVGAGMIGGGLIVSRSLVVFQRLASPQEFIQQLGVTTGAIVAIAAATGFRDRVFIGSLAACGLAAWVARLAGWPRRLET